jgi:hypothetical protein
MNHCIASSKMQAFNVDITIFSGSDGAAAAVAAFRNVGDLWILGTNRIHCRTYSGLGLRKLGLILTVDKVFSG